nr:unnamed protein product [Callosobruchus analis]
MAITTSKCWCPASQLALSSAKGAKLSPNYRKKLAHASKCQNRTTFTLVSDTTRLKKIKNRST